MCHCKSKCLLYGNWNSVWHSQSYKQYVILLDENAEVQDAGQVSVVLPPTSGQGVPVPKPSRTTYIDLLVRQPSTSGDQTADQLTRVLPLPNPSLESLIWRSAALHFSWPPWWFNAEWNSEWNQELAGGVLRILRGHLTHLRRREGAGKSWLWTLEWSLGILVAEQHEVVAWFAPEAVAAIRRWCARAVI